MEALRIDERPSLRNPVVLLAFAGWNDAGGAATYAIQFLIRSLGGRKFASIDPEEFYDFSTLRPRVQLREGIFREIIWPANEFFHAHRTGSGDDLIFGLGIEPHLKWKTYAGAIVDLAREFKATMVLTLGALLADVIYSRPTQVSGFSGDPALAARLELTPSRYEGPTGIVGVTNDACRRAGIPSASFWANVPHYVPVSPNPKAACALLRRLASLVQLSLDLSELEASAKEFDVRLAEAVARNPDVASYVKQLEERAETEAAEEGQRRGNGGNGHGSANDFEDELPRVPRRKREGD